MFTLTMSFKTLIIIGLVSQFIYSEVAIAEYSVWSPVSSWPLGICDGDQNPPEARQICMNARKLWHLYGSGAPEIEVAVVETYTTDHISQILSLHPWLSHRDIPVYQHIAARNGIRPMIPEAIPGSAVPRTQHGGYVEVLCQSNPAAAYCNSEPDSDTTNSFLAWRGDAGHELKMIGLIAGQDSTSMRRTGLAPFTNISLHYIRTNPVLADLKNMKIRFDLRPGTRVVNYSNEGDAIEFLDRQYSRIYAVALAASAGTRSESGNWPTDRLVVASSSNRTGVESIQLQQVRPHKLLPPEVVVGAPRDPRSIERVNRLPIAAYEIDRPDVPMIVVGGITSAGDLYGLSRVEPMIDFYVPNGMTLEQADRVNYSRAKRELGAIGNIALCRQTNVRSGVPTIQWGPKDDVLSSQYRDSHNDAIASIATVGSNSELGCRPREGEIYFELSHGNSVSAAITSGVAALMFSIDPHLSAMDAANILRNTALANRIYGQPVLDSRAALQTVVDTFVDRYIERALEHTSKGDLVSVYSFAEPTVALTNRSSNIARASSITTEVLAPGQFSQHAWASARDDFPLRLKFEVRSGSCHFNVLLDTEVQSTARGAFRAILREEFISKQEGVSQRCE